MQRVSRAAVQVDGRTVGRIGRGLLVLLGVERGDEEVDVVYMADKTAELRIFPDEDGKMNRSVEETAGAVLVVSQFTLAASTRKGRRPSYVGAADPTDAEAHYERFIARLRDRGLVVESGRFGAQMQVELVNDGPVTILLDPRSTGAEA
ncbi:MAG TPA: D-aminoacyl-tRNA deacylase [Candidatus Polarisedimenticolaceae bacterium]|nr:D-aminoacyl-tRNA deacylase [Candidatus Polarisedimenticolaceae bacterium]